MKQEARQNTYKYKSNLKSNSLKRRKKKHPRNPFYLILDILLVTLLILSILNVFRVIIPLKMIPTIWLVLLGVIALIIVLLNLILLLYRLKVGIAIFQRVTNVILVVVLFLGANIVTRIDKAVEQAIRLPTTYQEYVSVVTLRSSGIIDSKDLEHQAIGVQRSADTEHMKYAREILSTKWGSNLLNRNYEDYNSAIAALYRGDVKAILLSESYRKLVEENNADFKEKTAIIDAVEIEVPVVDIRKDIDITTNAFTILISGIDTLGKATQRANSDVTMLITINPLTKTILMNSIPRDSYLKNACLNDEYDKLTHTGSSGIDCTIKSVENAFDVEVNYYAKITFSSVIDVVNALGGIDVDVPMTFCERPSNRDYRKSQIIKVNKGQQTLNGEQALALARHRKTVSKGDLGRAKNQQLVINSIIKKALNPSILNKVDDLVSVVSETVQMNLTKEEIYSFVQFAASDLSKPWTITNHVVNGKNSSGECASYKGRELATVVLSDDEINQIKHIVKQTKSDTDLSIIDFNINNISVKTVVDEGETIGVGGEDYCYLD